MAKPLLSVTTDWVITYGTYIFVGPFDETMVTINRSGTSSTYVKGAAGIGSVVVNPDLEATITVNVHQGSPDSAFLEKAYIAWIKTGAALPLGIKNTRDGSVYVAEAAWIEQLPDVVASTGVTMHAWTLHTGELIPETQDGVTA